MWRLPSVAGMECRSGCTTHFQAHGIYAGSVFPAAVA